MIVLVVALVLGVMIFAGLIPIGGGPGGQVVTGNLVMWGFARSSTVSPILTKYNEQNQNITVSYVEKNPAAFDREYIEALANGAGPDLLLLPQDLIWRYKGRLTPIPYASFPAATFRDSFVSMADLYLDPRGILGLPVILDPMVMYYNRNLLDSAGVAKPPEFWDEFLTLAPILTKQTTPGSIDTAGVALGTYSNVTNAKEIISAMILQSGNPVTLLSGANLIPNLSDAGRITEAVLRFYTEFSNPSKEAYSWNRSFSSSRNAFISENLSVYFGFASELFSLRETNPNLNFDVAKLPQSRTAKTEATFGKLSALAISKNTKNPPAALAAVNALSAPAYGVQFAQALSLPPPRRDLLAVIPPSPHYLKTFYRSALISKAWLDPSPEATDLIFKNMIDNIVSGRFTLSQSISEAQKEMSAIR